MSVSVHKNSNSIEKKSGADTKTKTKITVLDIERENRQAKVTSLCSKGLNQEEIALQLHVDQSTVSRDLQLIRLGARIEVEKYLREDILFEYLRYMAASDEIARKLWGIVQDENTSTKDKIYALSQLEHLCDSRLQILTGGPESYMNIKKSSSEIDMQRLLDSEPFLKDRFIQNKLFPKGLSGLRR